MQLVVSTRHAIAIVALLLVGVVAVTITHTVYQICISKSISDMLQVMDGDGLYEASATILALVGFGSTIGVRISSDRTRATTQLSGLILVFGSSGVVIITQVAIMVGLCCLNLNQITYALYLLITGMALIMMMFGYILLIAQQKEEEKAELGFKHEMDAGAEDLATDSEQASDTSTRQDT